MELAAGPHFAGELVARLHSPVVPHGAKVKRRVGSGEAMNLPAMNPQTSEQTPPSQPPVILLVEDESMVRAITRQVLEHAGYRVLESSGPEEALLLAREYAGSIRLLLTDVVMPGMNGAELADRLEAAHPELTTVFMSGYAESEVLRHVMRRKSAAHIQKPFTVESLLSRVREAWRRD